MRKILLAIGLMLLCGSASHAEDLYFGQDAAGSGNGDSCPNRKAVTFFNTAANWGGGAGEIDPGDTAHVCGTVTTGVVFQASGTSGNVITLKFESGAKFSAAAYSGIWVDTNGKSYIVVDGGIPCGSTNGTQTACSTNLTGTGIIENTANGTSLANQVVSAGVANGSICGSNVEIKNLIVQNIYVKGVWTIADESSPAQLAAGIFHANCGDNILIHDNTVMFAAATIGLSTSGSPNNWQIYNNVVRHAHWGITMQKGGGVSVTTNWMVYGNDINIYDEWSQTNNYYHTDPIILWGTDPSSYADGVYVYNNYLHGDWAGGACASGAHWISGWFRNIYVFNTVIDTAGGGTCNGHIAIGSDSQSITVANNTLLNASGEGISGPNGNIDDSYTIYNNITYNVTSPLLCSATEVHTIDHNNYYGWNAVQPGPTPWSCGAFATAWNSGMYPWRGSTCGITTCDPNGSIGNPNLAASYPFTLGAGSAAIGLGKNLYSICNGQPNPGLGALCYDKAGTARPSSGAWDSGAYQYDAGGSPAPPHHLTVIIN